MLLFVSLICLRIGLTMTFLGNLKDLDVDKLLVHGCNWVDDYLKHNSKVSQQERHLCDRIKAQS